MERYSIDIEGNPWRLFEMVVNSDLPPGEKLTLLSICSLVRTQARYAATIHVSQRVIGEISGYTPTTTWRHIKSLSEKGWVNRIHQNGHGAIYDITEPRHDVK